MNIQLIKGSFHANDSIELMSQLIQVKIKFHEQQASNSHNEEDIKMRESRIKELQNELADARKYLSSHGDRVTMDCILSID